MKLKNVFKEAASRMKAAKNELNSKEGFRRTEAGFERNPNEEQKYFSDRVRAAAKALLKPS